MEPHYISIGRGGRVAEGTGLLNRRSGYTATEGSNPSLSAEKAHSSELFFYTHPPATSYSLPCFSFTFFRVKQPAHTMSDRLRMFTSHWRNTMPEEVRRHVRHVHG